MTATEDHARTIFLAALEQAPEQWPAFLDEGCGGDASLRALVDRLLDAHRAMGSIHGGRAADVVHAAPAVTMDAPPREAPGTVIGPYKLLQQIGEGGMGVVFLAEQQHPVRRQVALKVIKAGMDTRQVVARFESERQALALMDHPNIARVLDAGATDGGRPYFVMELVKGVPITRYCDDQKLTPRDRLGLFVQVCQAVQHAHQKGIIHRDLKPSNVLIALYDGKPVPKVIDFGVAKATGGRLTEHTAAFTGFGSVVGTPEYMSPEQAELNQLDVDTRSDVYSLGVILYELLTGSTPIEHKRVREAALLEVLRVVREQDPPRPSTRLSTTDQLASIAASRGLEPRKLGVVVRGELDWIVMKALEKDRARRYETANGFAADVQRYLADEAVQACPPSAGYRLRKFARRNKAGLAVASLVLFFLVLLGSGVGWAVRDRAARDAEAAQKQAARQVKVAGQVESILAEVDRLEQEQKWPEALAAARRAESAVAGGEADAEAAERVRRRMTDLEFIDRLEQIRMRTATLVESRFDNAGALREYVRAFRDYGVDLDELAVDSSIARLKTRPTLAIPLAAALDHWIYLRAAVREKDVADWKRLVAIARGLDPDPQRDRLRSTWGRPDSEVQDELRRLAESFDVRAQHPATVGILALNLRRVNQSDSALRLLRDAQVAYPGDFWLNFGLATALAVSKDHEGAIRFYTAAAAIRPDSPALNNLGTELRTQEKLDEAIACYRRAIELNPRHAGAHYNLAQALNEQNRIPEAIEAYRKAIAFEPRDAKLYVDQGVAMVPHAYFRMGKALEKQGTLDETIACFRQVTRLEPNFAAGQISLAWLLTTCADVKLRDAAGALAAARKAVELEQSRWSWQVLGWAHYRSGNWKDSIEALDKSCTIDNGSQGADAAQWFFLAMAHWQIGEKDKARAWYDRAVQWMDQNAPKDQGLRRFRAEAAELLDVKMKK